MKNKLRGVRRHNTYCYAIKQRLIARLNQFSNSKDFFLTTKKLGYYKKQAHMDCGRPKCGICGNPRKNKKSHCYNDIKKHERTANINYKEFKKDLKFKTTIDLL